MFDLPPFVSGERGPIASAESQSTTAQSSLAQPSGGTLQCLIVSSRESRREWLSLAALDGGWQTSPCEAAVGAARLASRRILQLAIVDLEGIDEDEIEDYRRLTESLARQTNLLLLVCGNEGKPSEEIWARQLGVWMYLAGVTPGFDLTLFCNEALQLAQRRAANTVHAGQATAGVLGR